MNEDDDALSALAYQQELEHQQWLLEYINFELQEWAIKQREQKTVDFIQ